MEPLSLNLDQLQERLGELLVALLHNSQTTPDGYDPSPLVSGFGQLIATMQQIENDATATPGVYADSASALGKNAYQLLERAAQRLLHSDMSIATPITQLQSGFADWVRRHGGIAVGYAGMHDKLQLFESEQKAPLPHSTTYNTTLQAGHAPHRRTLH